MIVPSQGKYLTKQITTTPEVIAALSPIEQRICQALIKAGDIQLVESEGTP